MHGAGCNLRMCIYESAMFSPRGLQCLVKMKGIKNTSYGSSERAEWLELAIDFEREGYSFLQAFSSTTQGR